MSHTFTFTITGDERTCLAWQGQFTKFLGSSGLPLPPQANLKISQNGGGNGRAAPPVAYAAPPTMAYAAPPTATYAAPPTTTYAAPPTASGGGITVTPAVNKLLDQVRKSVRQHGAVGISGIGRKFRIIDDSGDGKLDAEEFGKAMRELGFKYSDQELQLLYKTFDENGDGTVNYDEFLGAVRPPMSLRRKRLVQKVFEMIDTDKSGVLTADDLKSRFNPQGDPRVQGRKLNAQQVAAEFLNTFDVFDHDGNVGLEEFTKYYQGVSASIDEDDYFELMIRNAWHMSGGTGWCANTTCLRVLVIHQDGTQTVEEVKNDLGIDKNNRADVIKRLTQQGITDIVDIKLTA